MTKVLPIRKAEAHIRNAARDSLRELRDAELTDLWKELTARGIDLSDSGKFDLVKDKKQTFELLAGHLARPYSPFAKGLITYFIFGIKPTGVLREVVTLFENEPLAYPEWPEARTLAKDYLANAIASLAKSSDLDLLIPVLHDQTQGSPRAIILSQVLKWTGPRVEQVLMSLAADPDLRSSIEYYYKKRAERESKNAAKGANP